MPRSPPNFSVATEAAVPVATVFPGVRTQGRGQTEIPERGSPVRGSLARQSPPKCSGCRRSLSADSNLRTLETSFTEDAGRCSSADRRTPPTTQEHISSNHGARPPNSLGPPAQFAGPRAGDTTDLCTRTSWVDAHTAYKQVQKGKASGNKYALWLRWRLQKQLYSLGCFIQKHCGKVLFLGLLLLSLCCVGLKTASLETNVEKLWVEEGGRLQQELEYTKKVLGEGSGSTHELMIQTPADGGSLLSNGSLMLHYKALRAAIGISVELFDRTWKFTDLCFKTSFPSLDEEGIIDSILERLQPCTIITPLDCFWEASKLLGPEIAVSIPGYPGQAFRWTNLDPKVLLNAVSKTLSNMGSSVPVASIHDMLTRAGVGSAYQDKPCLNPADVDCPKTAPNKNSTQNLDIGRQLTGGCSGLASRYMHWQENLIVGGVTHNKDGTIIKVEALQSMILLQGERDIYEYMKSDFLTTDWSIEKAGEVLRAWQRKFSQEINKVAMTSTTANSTTDNIYPFSSASMLDLLQDFSKVSTVRVAIGYALMLVYACISLMRWSEPVQSQSGVGMAGVLLVSLSVAAGLGLCSVSGITFNASTTQIIPFLALGIGVDDMFLLAHTVAEIASKNNVPFAEQTGESLKRVGVSILVTSLSNACAFFIAAIVPIPALRAFCLQAALLVLFNLATILLVFPAVVSIDTIRREQQKIDLLCCLKGTSSLLTDRWLSRGRSPPPDYYDHTVPPAYINPGMSAHQTIIQAEEDGTNPVTVLAPPRYDNQSFHCVPSNAVCPVNSTLPASTTSSQQCLTPEDSTSCNFECSHKDCCSWPLTRLARNVLAPLLQKTPVKIFVIVVFTICVILGIVGTIKVQDGLEITDVVPRDTLEYKFLKAQSKYFGFYNFYAVTQKDFDYAKDQQMLFDYHQAYQQVENIIKRDDGTIPDFWLVLMRSWLLDVQTAFDSDWKKGTITQDGWYKNATDDGVIGYMLILQTGDMDKQTDKARLFHGRLVDSNGIIYQNAFYNYLTAWAAIDSLAYYSSEANFRPLPKDWSYIRHNIHGVPFYNVTEDDVIVLKSQPLIYSQLAFYLHELGDTTAIKQTVIKIRDICDKFATHGLPNYPSGIIFTFWEQYLHLRFYLMIAFICVFSGIFLVISIILLNPWTAFILVLVLAMMLVELFGFMGLIGIKLSAVPAVILIVSVGIGVEFTAHICLGYITAIGSSNKRMRMALEHMFAPVIHGAMTTFLGVIMMAVSEFDFIVKYFFFVLTALIVIGLLNGLILLPVLLSVIGPKAEVIPADRSDFLAPPTPELRMPPIRREAPTRAVGRRQYPRIPSEISLTTITEEPSSQHSSQESSQISIHVQPEVILQTTDGGKATTTTTTTTPVNTCVSTPSCSNGCTVTTVKTTTKVMVQVHAQKPGSSNNDPEFKSKKRKSSPPKMVVAEKEADLVMDVPTDVEAGDSDLEYSFSDDSLSSS